MEWAGNISIGFLVGISEKYDPKKNPCDPCHAGRRLYQLADYTQEGLPHITNVPVNFIKPVWHHPGQHHIYEPSCKAES